jgi:hypothetical protein
MHALEHAVKSHKTVSRPFAVIPECMCTHVARLTRTQLDSYNALADHGSTHLCGAPIVLNFIANAKEEDKRKFEQKVRAGCSSVGW